jgi:ABC-2 type transport system permease protein
VLMSAVFLAVLAVRYQAVLGEVVRSTAPEDLEIALRELRLATFNPNLLPGIVAIFLKAAIFAALTLFVSTFASSSVFTIMVSVSAYFIGHLQSVARGVWLEESIPTPLTKIFLALVSLLFPDLQIFSLVDDVAVGTAVPALLFLKTAGLGVIYTLFYLVAAYFVFAGKEL